MFGLEGDPGPCAPASFDAVTPHALFHADTFSIAWDRSFAVASIDGLPYQVPMPSGMPVPIELGGYTMMTLALAPEGTSMFYTVSLDDPQLQGALRGDNNAWAVAGRVPAGTYAGTPSADEFGPRRVLVRLFANEPTVQEYEDDNGMWKAHGDVHDYPGELAPNLTPNGLTMVYTQADPVNGGLAGVFLATRTSIDAWFGDPVVILTGNHDRPQLLDYCKALYTIEPIVENGEVHLSASEYDLP